MSNHLDLRSYCLRSSFLWTIHSSLGYVAFTLEDVDLDTEATLSATKPDWRWQLTASGRFAHRKEYVVSEGRAHALHVQLYERMDGFRYEHGVEVRGHLFVMRKNQQDKEL